jgi:uncharacterized membrane protein YeaQ/YmgE (transglycosylase-associated protein family)
MKILATWPHREKAFRRTCSVELLRSPDTKTILLDFQSFSATSSSSLSSLIVTMPWTDPGRGFVVPSFFGLVGALISFLVFSFSDPSLISVLFFVTIVAALLVLGGMLVSSSPPECRLFRGHLWRKTLSLKVPQ